MFELIAFGVVGRAHRRGLGLPYPQSSTAAGNTAEQLSAEARPVRPKAPDVAVRIACGELA